MTAPLKPDDPDRLKNLWLPLGPGVVIEGQAWGQPNVSGRVVDLQVSPSGTRVYAATAGGGVWYSNDEGASWLALGAWVTTPHVEQLDYFANTLACGSVAVAWDTTPNGEKDTVFVGTGETTPRRQGYPGSQLAGVGVLTAVDPVGTTRANPFDPVWTREVKDLEGRGVYRLAMRPGHAGELIAATSDGLYARSATGPWTKITAKPFDTPRVVTDALWTAAGISVALDSAGVWQAPDLTSQFTEIDLPDRKDGRISLAASADGTVVYALGAGPRLWRINGGSAKRVGNVPVALFGDSPDAPGGGEEEEDRPLGTPEHELPAEVSSSQASYDIVLAVDPDHPDVVVLGGAAVDGSAAIFKCTVKNPGSSNPILDYNPANDLIKGRDPTKISPSNDPTFIAKGVHADVHALVFAKRGGNLDLWVGCDGGIYRSTRAGRNFTWEARNNGLAVLEPGYVACHPASDGDAALIVGTQDNGVLERSGDTVWKTSLWGDGGGVAFNPLQPDHYVGQSQHAGWASNFSGLTRPVLRTSGYPPAKPERGEWEKANFYSAPAAITTTNPPGVRLALGTNRVWVSEDWGTTWFTVPTKSDPRNNDPKKGKLRSDEDQDVFYDDGRAQTLACRWKDENELYVLNAQSVQRYFRDTASNAWKRGKAITDQHNKCFAYKESDIEGTTMPYLPPLGYWSDLAVHVPGPDGTTSLYVACTSLNATLKMDTLWFYDGSGDWLATGLRAEVKAPALAVVVHPIDTDTVFVGTTVGVYKGTMHHPAHVFPTWSFDPFSIGLPEAAVQDLAFYRDPPTGTPTTLLLRAALQSRGVWEVDLLQDCDEQTYLRVHKLDSRRHQKTSTHNPMGGALDPFLSPDILIRRGPPVSPETAPKPPLAFFPIDATHNSTSFELWTFQTAFRQVEPACRPTGSWSDMFEALLVDYKKSHGLGDKPRIDEPDWDNVVTDARVFIQPWAAALPTEADFLQLVRDQRNQLQPGIFAARYTNLRLRADVLVHHRGLQPVKAADVSVLLLLRQMPESQAAWPLLSIDKDWKQSTVLALASGGIPTSGWTDNWAPAATTSVQHLPDGAGLSAGTPRAVTFDLALPTAVAAGTQIMLLAVCSRATATLTEEKLPGDTLGDLVLQSKHVAAHALELA